MKLYMVFAPTEDEVQVAFEYSSDLFDAETVAGWAERFAALSAEVTAAPEAQL